MRQDPNLIVGLQTSDDAAVYRLSDDLAMVQTVDFFPPIVDDAYTYGAIAAANSMSDIFAMGGDVLMALSVAAFPEDLSLDILSKIFEGAADKAAEVGIVIAGGHTVTDVEPKYGLIVTGRIHPDKVLTKAGAKPGDHLYLSKPIGTGVITTAMKAEAADQDHAQPAIESMLLLNRAASELARDFGIRACTDITGFGLIGHATEVAIKSEVGIILNGRDVPLLPGAERYAGEGRLPGGAERNREFYMSHPECGVTVEAGVSDLIVDLMVDPETSGGLLMSVPEDKVEEFNAAAGARGVSVWPVGLVVDGRGITIRG